MLRAPSHVSGWQLKGSWKCTVSDNCGARSKYSCRLCSGGSSQSLKSRPGRMINNQTRVSPSLCLAPVSPGLRGVTAADIQDAGRPRCVPSSCRRNMLYLHPPSLHRLHSRAGLYNTCMPGWGWGGAFKWLVLACQDAAWGDVHRLMFQAFAMTTDRGF